VAATRRTMKKSKTKPSTHRTNVISLPFRCHSEENTRLTDSLILEGGINTLHDAQLAKPLQHILVHAAQPLLLELLLAARVLNGVLQVVAHDYDEVEAVHRVRVDELALALVFWGFGLGGPVWGWFVGPVEAAIERVSV
jgi:hypothetical protein